MNFEVIFGHGEEKIITEKGSYIALIGGVACVLSNDAPTHLKTIFHDLDIEKAKAEAQKMLERCFSSRIRKKESRVICCAMRNSN